MTYLYAVNADKLEFGCITYKAHELVTRIHDQYMLYISLKNDNAPSQHIILQLNITTKCFSLASMLNS